MKSFIYYSKKGAFDFTKKLKKVSLNNTVNLDNIKVNTSNKNKQEIKEEDSTLSTLNSVYNILSRSSIPLKELLIAQKQNHNLTNINKKTSFNISKEIASKTLNFNYDNLLIKNNKENKEVKSNLSELENIYEDSYLLDMNINQNEKFSKIEELLKSLYNNTYSNNIEERTTLINKLIKSILINIDDYIIKKEKIEYNTLNSITFLLTYSNNESIKIDKDYTEKLKKFCKKFDDYLKEITDKDNQQDINLVILKNIIHIHTNDNNLKEDYDTIYNLIDSNRSLIDETIFLQGYLLYGEFNRKANLIHVAYKNFSIANNVYNNYKKKNNNSDSNNYYYIDYYNSLVNIGINESLNDISNNNSSYDVNQTMSNANSIIKLLSNNNNTNNLFSEENFSNLSNNNKEIIFKQLLLLSNSYYIRSKYEKAFEIAHLSFNLDYANKYSTYSSDIYNKFSNVFENTFKYSTIYTNPDLSKEDYYFLIFLLENMFSKKEASSINLADCLNLYELCLEKMSQYLSEEEQADLHFIGARVNYLLGFYNDAMKSFNLAVEFNKEKYEVLCKFIGSELALKEGDLELYVNSNIDLLAMIKNFNNNEVKDMVKVNKKDNDNNLQEKDNSLYVLKNNLIEKLNLLSSSIGNDDLKKKLNVYI